MQALQMDIDGEKICLFYIINFLGKYCWNFGIKTDLSHRPTQCRPQTYLSISKAHRPTQCRPCVGVKSCMVSLQLLKYNFSSLGQFWKNYEHYDFKTRVYIVF